MPSQLHCTVSGLVQGVGFRYFVYRKASELGLGGWVRNLRDGSVELVASGPRNDLESLLAAVRHGPRSAMVKDVSVEWGESDELFTKFEVG